MGRYAFHVDDGWDAASGEKARGNSTAFTLNVRYRIQSIKRYVHGDWLDFGCADGGYAQALLDAGAAMVAGVDVEAPRIEEAIRCNIPNTAFFVTDGHTLPFTDAAFDGAFMNETMEHVFNERESLAELHRVIKQGGILAVISPNRWFPFEAHTVRIGKWVSKFPTPLIPWLPKRLTSKWVDARNYWPHELRDLVADNGFDLVEVGYIWPVFEMIPWLPASVIRWYQRHIWLYSHIPIIGRFGVSNLVVGRRR